MQRRKAEKWLPGSRVGGLGGGVTVSCVRGVLSVVIKFQNELEVTVVQHCTHLLNATKPNG